MKIRMEFNKIDWWFWAVTLLFIVVALSGWVPGYYLVIAVSALQVLYFYSRHKSLTAFDTQVRVAYFACTLLGFMQQIRFPFYIILFLGTFMVVFFNRCGIALVLKYMPWNRQPVHKIHS